MKIIDEIILIPGGGNSYLIERKQECVLIDTGMSKKASKLIKAINSNFPYKPLKAVIITHSHQDHRAGLEILRKIYEPSVIAHEEESPYIEKTEELPSLGGFGGFMIKMLDGMMGIPGSKVDQKVVDNDIVYGLKVMHLPGHTPGTIALYDIENQALYCSDIINADKRGKKILPPKKDYALDYEQALKSSLRMLNETSPSVILPGHGSPILEPEEVIKVYLDEYGKV
ncbi:MAG: MBL fold metallo-hydrolase [Candidatus Heimdallarchaeota archaeon]|nr:MBL fold metallo-hydrolase [Candidatus Heimdallarchaeota archaeon]MCK4877837.1 MBL fold metallo-hydrolase [Candidatus Heimdallarchaeota archaeon]